MLNKAITSVTLRIVVAGYIIFIAIQVINGTKSETSTIPAWVGSLVGFVFIAAACGFIIYSIRSFLKARQKALLDAEEEAEEKPAPQPEMSIAEKVRAAQAMIGSDNNKKTEDK